MTAVEWFESKLDELGIEIPYSIYSQAIEMEKQQIIDAHEHGNSQYSVGISYHIVAEKYYNETYSKNE